MRVQLFQVDNGECPYLPDRRWITHSFATSSLPNGIYERLLADGWRRSGSNVYQNHCPGCRCCTPARIRAAEYEPSKSQRRVWNRNTDVSITIAENTAEEEVFELYSNYVIVRHAHPTEPMSGGDAWDQYVRFLVENPTTGRMMKYQVKEKLVGVGWIDVLPNGLSSVYFAFDPEESRRSLGIYSIMRELELVREMGKEWLYLGFYVPGSPKMEYKGQFKPRQFAVNGTWTEDETLIPCEPTVPPEA